MKKTALFVIIFALAVLAVSAAGSYDNYLPVADVEKATGLQGVKTVPPDHDTNAGGDLNFAESGGKVILMVQLQDANVYKQYKGIKKYFKAPVNGVGNEAFMGPIADPQYTLVFRKGAFCVSLTTFVREGAQTWLSMDQLISLGKLIASRIK